MTMQLPDINHIINDSSLTMKEKRVKALKELGLRGSKGKYGSKDEAKAASKAKGKQRRDKNRAKLIELGLLKPREKMSDAERDRRKLERRAKRKNEKLGFRKLAKDHPEIAKEYGIDPKRMEALLNRGKKAKKKKKGKKGGKK